MNRRDFLRYSVVGAGVGAAAIYALTSLKLINGPGITNLIQKLPSGSGSMAAGNIMPHLLRRAGFGATPQELSTYQAMGFNGAVDHLINYQGVDNSAVPSQPNITMSYGGKASYSDLQTMQWWWLNRMVNTKRPLEEKMTLFWHNHFATAISKVESPYLMYVQNQFLRSNALGNFKDLLMGITADPAMLIWLDGNRSSKGNPNENFAREIMEVFSTGRGPYTEDDVKAAAKAFTGYVVNKDGTSSFVQSRHDNGTKTFLGQTGNFGPEDIINILVAHPATASTLASQIFSFFAYPYPDQKTVNKFAQVYLDSGYSIKALVEAVLKSDEFISTDSYLAQVKSPAEYVAIGLRSTGAVSKQNPTLSSMSNMGQALFDPPTVFGWPYGPAWIDSASVFERYNFPLQIQTSKEDSTSRLDPSLAFPSGQSSAAGVNTLATTLFPEGLPQEFLQVIQKSASTYTDPVAGTKDALRLTMASPFYILN